MSFDQDRFAFEVKYNQPPKEKPKFDKRGKKIKKPKKDEKPNEENNVGDSFGVKPPEEEEVEEEKGSEHPEEGEEEVKSLISAVPMISR